MSTSIPISGLNALGQVSSSDLLAVVKESTLTTFNVSLVVIAAWISASVEASSSLSSFSASYALSSSFANKAGLAITSNNLNYPNTSTASFAITASNAISASWAPIQGVTAFAISASWASASIWSTTSSFASQSVSASWAPVPISASWANTSIFATSASWASQSISSSNSTTASFALTASAIVGGSTVFLSQPIIIVKQEESEGSGGWYNGVPDASITSSSSRTIFAFADGWYNFNLSGSAIPSSVAGLIIEASANTTWGDGPRRSPFFVFVRDNIFSLNTYATLRIGIGYNGNAGQVAHTQGIYPVGLSNAFQWRVNNTPTPGFGILVRIIGYIK